MTYVANPAFIEELMAEPQASAALEVYGKQLSDEIKAAIPVRSGIAREHYGAMTPQIGRRGSFPDVELPILSSIWHLIEFGSVNNIAYAPIRRGAEAAHLQIDMAARS